MKHFSFQKFTLQHKWIWLIFTILAAIILHYQQLDCQLFLSTGDHGRDFYAAAQILDGKLPYRDYFWVYGPLMPFYYAIFFKWLGITIPSILVGKAFLNLITVIFFFLSICRFTSGFYAAMGALFFLVYQPEHFHTIAHSGGMTGLTVLIYFLLCYIKRPENKYLITSLILVLLLFLIKLNIGLAGFLAVFIAYLLWGNHKTRAAFIFGLAWFLAVPLIVFIIYFILLNDQPLYYLKQCLPYFKNDQFPGISLVQGIKLYISEIIQKCYSNPAFFILLGTGLTGFLRLTWVCFVQRAAAPHNLIRWQSCLLILAVHLLSLHEFLLSGTGYRLLWAIPSLFLFFWVASAEVFTAGCRRIFYNAFCLLMLFFTVNQELENIKFINQLKTPPHYFTHPRAKVYIPNSLDWMSVVSQTTDYLEKHLNKDQLFLALPYDCLYYYLTAKPSPTKLLAFFDFLYIPPEQEAAIIKNLEDKKVDWILISNRSQTTEIGLGTFGKTYCLNLGKYVEDNFEMVAQFGDWKNPSGWAWNHGTRILKRKTN